MHSHSSKILIKLIYLFTGDADDEYVSTLLSHTSNPDHFMRRYKDYKSKPYGGMTDTPSGIALSRTVLTMDESNVNAISSLLFTDHEHTS